MNANAPSTLAPLIDPFGRAITYVRVSVTDRSDFRCAYCMSEDMNFLPKRYPAGNGRKPFLAPRLLAVWRRKARRPRLSLRQRVFRFRFILEYPWRP